MPSSDWMYRNRDLIIGAFAGLVLGLPQGLRDLPQFNQVLSSSDLWLGYSVAGAFAGFFAGAHLISRANPSIRKRTLFSLLMVGSLSVGIPTIVRHYNGIVLQSLTLPGILFTSIGIAMFVGAGVSYKFSKGINTKK